MEKFTHSSQALAILIVYLIIMIGIGWYASRRIKGSADFIVAGRRLPLWLSVGTLVATWFCGGAVMGATSEAYSWGLQGIIWDPLSSVPAFILFILPSFSSSDAWNRCIDFKPVCCYGFSCD